MLLLSPPELQPPALSVYFGFFYILFFLASTFSCIPYDALGPELTDDYEDRSHLFFVSGLYDGVGALLAVALPVGLMILKRGGLDCTHETECWSNEGTVKSCFVPFGRVDFTTYDVSGITSKPDIAVVPDLICGDPTQINETFAGYCSCKRDCIAGCTVIANRWAYQTIGQFFGIWFITTMVNCCYRIKERSQLTGDQAMKPPMPLVPSLLNTFRNKVSYCILDCPEKKRNNSLTSLSSSLS